METQPAHRSHRRPWSLLLLACLMLAACEDRREPVKPTVATSAPTATVA